MLWVLVGGCAVDNPLFGHTASGGTAGGEGTTAGSGDEGVVDADADADAGSDSGGEGEGSDTSDADTWWNEDYCARMRLRVDAELIGEDLVSFPLLVSVPLPDQAVQPPGSDFAFVDLESEQLLPHELVGVDVDGRVLSWVRVPIVRADVDTVVVLYLCNPNGGAQEDPGKLWAEYSGVWHLAEAPPGSVVDASGKDNHGTTAGEMTASASVPGVVGRGLRFDGVNDGVDVPASSELNLGTSATLSAWARPETWQAEVGPIIAKSVTNGLEPTQNSYFIRATDGDLNFLARTRSTDQAAFWNGWTMLETWHYIAGTYDGAALRLYFDGMEVDEVPATGEVVQSEFDLHFGSWGAADGTRWWAGVLDEVRIATEPRSAAWLQAETLNHRAPHSFVVAGPVELQP